MFDISRMPESLKSYWLHGAGAAKIRWGQGGDFDRCCTAINAEITMEATSEQAMYELRQKQSREMTNGAGPFGPTPLRRM